MAHFAPRCNNYATAAPERFFEPALIAPGWCYRKGTLKRTRELHFLRIYKRSCAASGTGLKSRVILQSNLALQVMILQLGSRNLQRSKQAAGRGEPAVRLRL